MQSLSVVEAEHEYKAEYVQPEGSKPMRESIKYFASALEMLCNV